MIDWADIRDRTMLGQNRLDTFARLIDEGHLGAGSVAEVGVMNGGVSVLLKRLLPDRTVFAFDTFERMPKLWKDYETFFAENGFETQPGTEAWLQAQKVAVCKGVFPWSIPLELYDATFSLVHLDCDLEESIAAGLDFFWPRLDGCLVIDDLGRDETPGVKVALDRVIPDWASFVIHNHDYQLVLKRRS